MCGIAGAIGLEGRETLEPLVLRALDVQRHRGPDDSGLLALRECVLGHNRLSIIDIECGHQPMSNEDGSLWLVFNGEIFNYVELAAELRHLGHEFKTASDTETIIHAYEQWGTACVERFNGMWAFALWDSKESSLFCSRDRFGVKPFAYAYHDGRFLFASEPKALLAMDRSLATADEAQIYRFLRTGLTQEGNSTFFARIRQLPAGHNAWVRPGLEPVIDRYYNVAASVRETRCGDAECADQLRSVLQDSVRLRLRSDVPVGTCLSGGLDSSAIVALASGIQGSGIRTFTSTYPGTELDEREYADQVIDRFQTEPHFIEPRVEDFMGAMPLITWHQDAPTSAQGIYSQWHVMKLAAGRVKVLLDGQGADEILAGYPAYAADYTAALLGDAMRGKRHALGRFVSERQALAKLLGGSPVLAALKSRLPVPLRRVARSLARDVGVMSPEFRDAWRAQEAPPVRPEALGDPLNSSLLETLVRTSIPALLHYEDRNSMAFSIEARTPFLDYRVVELCLGLPYHTKIRGWRTKAVLRDAMASDLPTGITERRDKQGFPAPYSMWLRSDLIEPTRDLLLSPEARGRGIVDQGVVTRMLTEHASGVADHQTVLWRLTTLELWHRNFIDGFGAVTL